MTQPGKRAQQWITTTTGYGDDDVVLAHKESQPRLTPVMRDRRYREELEQSLLAPEAAHAQGAGNRALEEAPDPNRTCFERDRDRIVHSTAFRRLAGKTQVVVYPRDHQRTRLTHALEVAQVASSIAAGLGLNTTLTEAIALGHDCGHGPGGHASEEAFDAFIPEGFDHAPWGANVTLVPLNLCQETLDGIRNHSWSLPSPVTLEGEIVSWADRIAYCCHDFADAAAVGVVSAADLPAEVAQVAGITQREMLTTFIRAILATARTQGVIGMDPVTANALAVLRRFNYERIYTRPDSLAQAESVIKVLRGLVEYYVANPAQLPPYEPEADLLRTAVTYVGGMTDRFAFERAEELLGWDPERLPQGIGRGA